MSSGSKISQNLKRIHLYEKYKKEKEQLKKKLRDPNISLQERQKCSYELSRFPKNSSKVRQINRCSFSGRSRGYNRRFGISQFTLRMYASEGLIPGLKLV